MSKLATLFTLALLMSFTLSLASRLNPEFNGASSLPEVVASNKVSKAKLDAENCDGVGSYRRMFDKKDDDYAS
ncbi:putative phytosulfokines-like [Sesbania bispinosa]|nr:putative phytosulfokines-like [Sesbania bispinosa]